jgi:hypothetical protein
MAAAERVIGRHLVGADEDVSFFDSHTFIIGMVMLKVLESGIYRPHADRAGRSYADERNKFVAIAAFSSGKTRHIPCCTAMAWNGLKHLSTRSIPVISVLPTAPTGSVPHTT